MPDGCFLLYGALLSPLSASLPSAKIFSRSIHPHAEPQAMPQKLFCRGSPEQSEKLSQFPHFSQNFSQIWEPFGNSTTSLTVLRRLGRGFIFPTNWSFRGTGFRFENKKTPRKETAAARFRGGSYV
jgi:hypothetical protein